MNKRSISGLAALVIVFSGAGTLPAGTSAGIDISAGAAETACSGKCGEELDWTLDSGGTLTISGRGDMADYGYGEAPWGENADIKKVIIGSGVTGIGSCAFHGCENLGSVTVPGSAVRIGAAAFAECSSLKSIKLPEGLTEIGDETFDNCSSLSEIVIPDSVESIGIEAFYCCKALEKVTLPKSLKRISRDAFHKCTGLKEIDIPYGTMSIGKYAFSDCTELTAAAVPDTVTSIGSEAFKFCTSLKSLTIPRSAAKIGASAFFGCTSLAGVTIPESVESISEMAFGYYYDTEKGAREKLDGFKITGYTGTAAEKYAKDNGFKFVSLGISENNKYPVAKAEVNGRQFRLKWTAVPGAEKYGLGVYQSGKWRVKVQFAGSVTDYTSPRVKPGTYRMVVCAKVNGEWDTGNIGKRAFAVAIG